MRHITSSYILSLSLPCLTHLLTIAWNAYLCPPDDGFPAYRRLRFEDLTDTDYTNITRANASGILTRLSTTGSVRIISPFYSILFYSIRLLHLTHLCLQTYIDPATAGSAYRLDYDTNVVMNSEYLLEYGSIGEVPESIRILIYDFMTGNSYTGAGGEWLRIAIPYPSDANFTITINPSNRPVTAGTSRNQVSSSVYFWDSAAGLLWVGISADRDNFGASSFHIDLHYWLYNDAANSPLLHSSLLQPHSVP